MNAFQLGVRRILVRIACAGLAAVLVAGAAYGAGSAGPLVVGIVALPLATYAETSSALAVGVVASAEATTAVVFGLPAGALADRLPYRQVLAAMDVAMPA